MNRQRRREFARELKSDSNSQLCPLCNKKSLFISKPKEDYKCDITCVLCNSVIKEDVEAIPYCYCKI